MFWQFCFDVVTMTTGLRKWGGLCKLHFVALSVSSVAIKCCWKGFERKLNLPNGWKSVVLKSGYIILIKYSLKSALA